MESPAKAAIQLQNDISAAVQALQFPAGLAANRNDLIKGIMQKVDAKVFHTHNQSRIVEVHANFNATTANGGQVFELKIIWGNIAIFFLIMPVFETK